MPALILDNISFSYTARPLLDRITLRLATADRAVLIGPNGCGKTTLLRIAAGHLSPERGTVTRTDASTIPWNPVPNDDAAATVAHFLDSTFAPARELLARFETLSARLGEGGPVAAEYDRLLSEITRLDLWSLEDRVDDALAGLGLEMLTGSGRSRELATLSPGQRARLNLAVTLVARPQVLILDEPTNHLDVEASAYLSHMLRSWPGPVLMSSHDRAFIEDVATLIVDMDVSVWAQLARAEAGGEVRGVWECRGTYTDYLEAKRDAEQRYRALYLAQQEEKTQLRAHRQTAGGIARGGVRLANAEGKAKKFFADRAQSTATRRTRHDDRKLEALATREVRKPRGYTFAFPDYAGAPARQSAGLAVSARAAAIPGRLAPVTFDLSHGEHLVVTGANGSGKSTLLTWIATGTPPPATSSVAVSPDSLRLTASATVAQPAVAPSAQPSGTLSCAGPLAFVPQRLPRCGDPGFNPEVWNSSIGDLGTGILHPSMWATPIPELSAGNQRRAQLALALAAQPAVLVIDEPTNYLDLAAMHALEESLARWPGTIILATHDRWLITHWPGPRLHLPNSRLTVPESKGLHLPTRTR
ncbi:MULTISPECIES: ATP-binding cassette domain-containing protein [Actinotignum]|uniref:ATP-binding cassette domain-containing protein n=1 Tax=Actinotignum TaxID=1653174 RepID=UPI00254C8A9E|nr:MULTISPECIES: ATP-binding cassette domain-containing protein [Actinotignum]MDE1536036.1 ATP-binding cassette domain-containing protein [Actinotignum schaalii]MDK7272337.1 ATP-binding cassette domain-containing protein [Actinotignum schaalii]MDY5145341.1 ATP-binding cassette domain-containing protein [Actinotignum timonense]